MNNFKVIIKYCVSLCYFYSVKSYQLFLEKQTLWEFDTYFLVLSELLYLNVYSSQ